MQAIQCQRQTSIISMAISGFVISFDRQLQRLILIDPRHGQVTAEADEEEEEKYQRKD